MLYKKSISSLDILQMAINHSKYNTRKSKVNRKWTRYLKNNKLFDEYMIYLANHNAAGAEPHTYEQLSNICHNLMTECYYFNERPIIVDWVDEFRKFAWESIKWYDAKNILLYIINNGYR